MNYTYIRNDKCDLPTRSVVSIPGFTSGQDGEVVIELLKYFKSQSEANFLCYDPSGIANSKMKFRDCTFHNWVEDACNMINFATEMNDQAPIVIAKSMGGSIATNILKNKLAEIHSLILLCPAVNMAKPFHEWVMSVISEEQKNDYDEGNAITVDIGDHENWEPFVYSKRLADSFFTGNIDPTCRIDTGIPIRIIHGFNDMTVPYSLTVSNNLQDIFMTNDFQIKLIKNCDHVLISDVNGHQAVISAVNEMLLK